MSLLRPVLCSTLLLLASYSVGCTRIVELYFSNRSGLPAKLTFSPSNEQHVLESEGDVRLQDSARRRAVRIEPADLTYDLALPSEEEVQRQSKPFADTVHIVIREDGRMFWATPDLQPLQELNPQPPIADVDRD